MSNDVRVSVRLLSLTCRFRGGDCGRIPLCSSRRGLHLRGLHLSLCGLRLSKLVNLRDFSGTVLALVVVVVLILEALTNGALPLEAFETLPPVLRVLTLATGVA